MSNDRRESFWQNLFSDKSLVVLLGGGLFFLLVNIAVLADIDFRPNTWLYLLNSRFWSLNVYVSVALWGTAIWLALELTDIVEEHLPIIRTIAAVCILLAVTFALRTPYSLWGNAVIFIAACCAVRSCYLFYIYLYEKEALDIEEAKYFWGLSGILITGLIVSGIMYVIPVRSQMHFGMADPVSSEPLFTSCIHGLQELIQSGRGSFSLRLFGLLTMVTSVAFVYVTGMWIFVLTSRIRKAERETAESFYSKFVHFVAGCLPYIRIPVAVCALLAVVFVSRNYFAVTSPTPKVYLLWLDILIAVTVCCAVRSCFLLNDFRRGKDVDLKEATWFWGLSGFLLAGSVIFGIMDVILIKTSIYGGMKEALTESLLMSCYRGLRDIMGYWQGSFSLRLFWILVVVAAVAFIYVAGRWLFIIISKFREE